MMEDDIDEACSMQVRDPKAHNIFTGKCEGIYLL
jgi:hypothetical protein